ncbi:MAG: nucleoside hydrolase [Chlamydiales bacterium]|nr:nucleoside hydrolase [Chlamydiales bacterium]
MAFSNVLPSYSLTPVAGSYTTSPLIHSTPPPVAAILKNLETPQYYVQKIENGKVYVVNAPQSQPFLPMYQKLFSQEKIRALYVELDPGVDDAAALLQLVAASLGTNPEIGKSVVIEGVVPCVGNAILSQTEVNARELLELADSQSVPVFPGAEAPLAIENNATAIAEMNKNINATHFYGHDGLSDVCGWPKVNMPIQVKPGYQYAAEKIASASPENPITLISTSALTELSKTLNELVSQDAQKGLPAGSFAKNINAITIMGGCIDPKETGCNAPFNVPDTQKNSEANFYFDSDAAKQVFALCHKYDIPILLSPLDLTQQPGLLWGPQQTQYLRSLNNTVASQMAKVGEAVPYLDAPCFPHGTYPMHDLLAVACILRPDLFEVTPIAAEIGNVGQIIEDTTAPVEKRKVFVLKMPKQNQTLFFEAMLSHYKKFNNLDSGRSLWTIIGATIAAAGTALLGLTGGIICCRKRCQKNIPTEDTQLINKE